MFSKRKSRQVADSPYTGVSGIPTNRASTNAHAAVSAVATALKNANGSATNMQLPPTQVRAPPQQRHSSSGLSNNSLRNSHSRSSSMTFNHNTSSPMNGNRERGHHSARHSLTPQSLQQLNEQNDLRSIESDFSSTYGNESYEALHFSKHSLKQKVSFSDASSELSHIPRHKSQPALTKKPQQQQRQKQQLSPPQAQPITRQKTVKRYVPSGNGLVAIEVPVEQEKVNMSRLNSLRAAPAVGGSRKSSLLSNSARPRQKPISRSSSLTGISQQQQQQLRAQPLKQQTSYYNRPTSTIPEEGTIEQAKERLQRERELLEQQYYAKLEEERLYHEKLEKQRLQLEIAEKERLKKEHDEEAKRQRLEQERLAKEASIEAERENERQHQLAMEEAQKESLIEEAEAREAAVAALKEPEFNTAQSSTPVESSGDGTIVVVEDEAGESASNELDIVNEYKTEEQQFPAPTVDDFTTTSVPPSAEFSQENNDSVTDSTPADDSQDDSHVSMAKQLRQSMNAPQQPEQQPSPPVVAIDEEVIVLVNNEPQQQHQQAQQEAEQPTTFVPPRSDRRLSGSDSASPLARKKSALKQGSRFSQSQAPSASPSKSPSAAAQAYLSLTTAENTRLNAMNTQSSLSLSQPQQPNFNKKRESGIHQFSPAPKTLRDSGHPKPKNSPAPAARESLRPPRRNEEHTPRQRPITISLPQQVSPGKFVLPKSDAKKKADALYKKANSRPRQDEEELRKNLPPLQRKSSFDKTESHSANQKTSRLSMRPPPGEQQYDHFGNEEPMQHHLQNNSNSHNSHRQSQHHGFGGGFKSRFDDSDSDSDVPVRTSYGAPKSQHNQPPPPHPSRTNGPKVTRYEEEDITKKKKKFGKLKKIFGRN